MRRSHHRYVYPLLSLLIYLFASLPLFFGHPSYPHVPFLSRLHLTHAFPLGVIGFVVSWLLKQLVSQVPLPEDARKAAMIERVALFFSGVCEEVWRLCVVGLMIHSTDKVGWEGIYMVGVSWCAVEGIVAYYKLRPIAPPWPLHPSLYRSETSNTSDSPTLITAPISQASLSAHSSAHSSPGHRPRPKLGKYIRAREISRTASFFGSFYRPSASPPSRNRSQASTREGHSDAESGRQSRGRARDDDEYSRDADSEREDTGDESDTSSTTQQALLSSSLPFDDPPLLPSTLSRSKTAPSIVPRIITTPSNSTIIKTYGTLDPPAPETSTFRSGSPTSYHAHITFSHSPPPHRESSPPDSPLISVHEFDFPPLPDSTPSPTYPSFPSYTTSFTPHHFPAPSPPPSLLPSNLRPRDPRRVFGVAVNKLPVWMAAMWRLGSLLRHSGHAILYAGVLGAGWRWGEGGWWVVAVLGGVAVARGMNTVVWYTGRAKRRGMVWSSGWLVGMTVVLWGVAGWGWRWY